jgi:hypothetical protein
VFFTAWHYKKVFSFGAHSLELHCLESIVLHTSLGYGFKLETLSTMGADCGSLQKL